MSDSSPYKQFAANMLQPDSKLIPEILRCLTTEDQAALLVAMPGTDEELARKTNRTTASVAADLADMFRKGLAFKKIKDETIFWRPPAHLVQFHDATLTWPEATPEFIGLWRRYMEEEWPQLAEGFSSLMPRSFTRVVPVNRAIDPGRVQVLAPDSVRDLVGSASRLAVTPCTCRLSMQRCDGPIDVCLQINRGAEYTIERGSGREIDRSEALAILTQAQEAGLVHVTMNKADAGHFICNCCGCCCQSFSLLRADGPRLCDPSRYRPAIDRETCSECGTCEERCWFDAIALSDAEGVQVNEEKCLGCGQCAVSCPEGAIQMTAVRDPEFIPS